MPRILDVEQAMLLLELEAPFDQRGVQLARRRMAKRWHPDIAPPGRQHEHQRHLQAINEAADQLEQLAESVRGGRVTRNAVKVSAAATRKAREEAGRRAYEEEQRAAGQRRGPRQARPVRLARARPLGRPPLRALRRLPRVGRGHRDRDLLLRRRRGHPAVGPRAVLDRRAHGAGGLAAVRRLLDAGSVGRPGAAVHDRRAARAGRGRRCAGRPAARLRARRRAVEPVGAATADDRVLAGGQPAGGGPHGPRLGAGRDRPADARAVRVPDLRGHGRDRLGRRGRRASHRPRAQRRLRLGATRAAAAAADGPAGRDLRARAGQD